MSISVGANGLKIAMRVTFTGLALALLSGCSSDVTRFTNPFGSSAMAVDEMPTSDIPAEPVVKRNTVTSKPLAAPMPASGVQNSFAVPATPSPRLSQSKAVVEPSSTASIVKHPVSSQEGWSAAGGTPIVVATGETVKMLSLRYGVPENVLLSVNGFTSAAQVQPGARMVIPVFNGGAKSASNATQDSSTIVPRKAVVVPQTDPKMKFVSGPQPANSPAGKPAVAATQTPPNQVAKPVLAAKAGTQPVPLKDVKAKDVAQQAKPVPLNAANANAKPVVVASIAPEVTKPHSNSAKATGAPVDTTPTASLQKDVAKPVAEAVPAAPVADAAPEFRWPAHGRVIQGFKAGSNDGINIAVPEGTVVKAAEAGVVAYAGSELKGYGNLVLIRHPNGYVSAYANNSDIMVKRGETVKRGQPIAKSGQTGNVTSAQLHFELRKGSTPVDPTGYLP